MDAPMPQTLKLTIKSLDGNQFTIEAIEDNKLVSDLKEIISKQQNGLPIVRQRLVYKGRPMGNLDKLSDYNLVSGCTLHLITSQKPSLSSSSSSSATSSSTTPQQQQQHQQQPPPIELTSEQKDFDNVLRNKLAPHLNQETIDKLMVKFHQDFHRDLHSASLDDIERLSSQKLKTQNQQQ